MARPEIGLQSRRAGRRDASVVGGGEDKSDGPLLRRPVERVALALRRRRLERSLASVAADWRVLSSAVGGS